ncbi:Uncharacterised protein [Candidatus Gugararchaeum adminiculabundum]|nr:Uncharacterised protein [Candidatus Gugararchaeum adminiculabundum]
MALKNCVSCGKLATEFAEIPCANCGEKMIRCKRCRQSSNPYKCKKCGRDGP